MSKKSIIKESPHGLSLEQLVEAKANLISNLFSTAIINAYSFEHEIFTINDSKFYMLHDYVGSSVLSVTTVLSSGESILKEISENTFYNILKNKIDTTSALSLLSDFPIEELVYLNQKLGTRIYLDSQEQEY